MNRGTADDVRSAAAAAVDAQVRLAKRCPECDMLKGSGLGDHYAHCSQSGQVHPAKSKPKRIQLRRTKGWRKPEGAVVVARPTKWGNPWTVHPRRLVDGFIIGCGEHDGLCAREAVTAVRLYRHALLWPIGGDPRLPSLDDLRELRGKDLACYCPLDQPCHADVLLELANA